MDRERIRALGVPEDLVPLVRGFRICATCFEPYEFRLQGAVSRQRCRCPDKVPEGRTWPGYDFNEHLHLCECCSMMVLRSGSRWSVWFCEACKGRVDELNRTAGGCVIPIGRHSLMNGVGVSGREVSSAGEYEIDAIVEAFLDDLVGVFGAQERLHAFAAARRREIASELGFPSGEDIDLPVWLESLAAAATTDSSGSATLRLSRSFANGLATSDPDIRAVGVVTVSRWHTRSSKTRSRTFAATSRKGSSGAFTE